MLAGSLLAAIADASAWRSRCGWATIPTLAARRAKARLAWLGLTGVPRSVRNTRSNSTGCPRLHQPAQGGHGVRAAALLGGLGDVRARFPDNDCPAALAGAAPVTITSGKRRVVKFRWACDKKLRNALIDLADDSRNASPWAAKVYAQALARTGRHPHAVRILARAWIRVIWRLWQDGVAYDPAKHRGAVRLLAA